MIFSCFKSSCWCICCCIGSRIGVLLEVAAELLVVPASGVARVIALVLEVIGVEEEDALDGVVAGKVGGYMYLGRPESSKSC